MTKKKILALSGSLRKNSSNEVILETLRKRNQEFLELKIFNGISELPFFNPDLDYELLPISVQNFRQSIESSDGVLICTPEYVFSPPALLKNAIEWTVSATVFTDKPTAIIVASNMGEKTIESLSLILKTIQAKTSEDTQLLLKGMRSRISEAGEITDGEVLARLERLMEAFLKKM